MNWNGTIVYTVFLLFFESALSLKEVFLNFTEGFTEIHPSLEQIVFIIVEFESMYVSIKPKINLETDF